jgi:hypothetical protein
LSNFNAIKVHLNLDRNGKVGGMKTQRVDEWAFMESAPFNDDFHTAHEPWRERIGAGGPLPGLLPVAEGE